MNDRMIYDKIYRFLFENWNQSHSIQNICRYAECDKRTANRCLYDMLKRGMVKKTKEKQPPCWQYQHVKIKTD